MGRGKLYESFCLVWWPLMDDIGLKEPNEKWDCPNEKDQNDEFDLQWWMSWWGDKTSRSCPVSALNVLLQGLTRGLAVCLFSLPDSELLHSHSEFPGPSRVGPKASASIYGIFSDLWSSYSEPDTVHSFVRSWSHWTLSPAREEIAAIIPGAWSSLPIQVGAGGQGRANLQNWTQSLCTILPPEIEGHILVPALLFSRSCRNLTTVYLSFLLCKMGITNPTCPTNRTVVKIKPEVACVECSIDLTFHN